MFLFMGVCFSVSAFGLLGGALWAYFKQQRQMESSGRGNRHCCRIDHASHGPRQHHLPGSRVHRNIGREGQVHV